MLTAPLDAAAGTAGIALAALTELLRPLPADLAAPAAIVVLTAAIRLLLLPASYARFRITREQRRTGERIARLRTQYARQPGRQRRELAEPLRQRRRGMALGLIPMLVQLPFFVALYRLFSTASIAGHANGLLAQTLFGTPLGHQWLTSLAQFGLFHPYSLVFAGLFGLLALVAYAASRLADRDAALAAPAIPGTDFPVNGLRRVGRLLPYGTVVVAAFVPLAAGLYLLTTTAWTVAERWVDQAVTARRAVAT